MGFTANRYAQYSMPKYTPRTLQDLMVAPAYMRGQHDALDVQRGEMEASLAQYDSLAEHSDILKAKQQELYDEMSAQAGTLETEGFSPSSKSNFIRFNKKYQQAVGPMGDIGKIQTAKAMFDQERSELLQNGSAMGFSPQQIQLQIDAAREKYGAEFAETGEIKNMDMPLPPEYADIQDDIVRVNTILGDQLTKTLDTDGYEIETDENGLFVIRTEKKANLTQDNLAALQKAEEYLNARWSGSGKGAQAAPWLGLTNEQISKEISAGLGMMKKTRREDLTQIDYKFVPIPKPQVDNNGKPMNFITSKVQGYNAESVDPNSILRSTDNVENVEFDTNGTISNVATEYATYEDKIASYENEYKSKAQYDEELGLYTILAPYSSAGGEAGLDKARVVPIFKDGQHMVQQLDELRTNNPLLEGLSDKELITRLQNFKEDLASNYVTADIPVGANYEWTTELLFGNAAGSGENSVGIVSSDREVTIAGVQKTMVDVLDDLGYSDYEDFKLNASPAVQGYITSLGKWKSTAYDSKGRQVNMFVEASPELRKASETLITATTGLMQGKSLVNLGESIHPQYKGYTKYLVNDFSGNPVVVLSNKKNVKQVSDIVSFTPHFGSTKGDLKLVNEGDFVGTYNQFVSSEIAGLRTNSLYIDMSGVGATSKNKR